MRKRSFIFTLALLACFMLGDPSDAPAQQGPPEQPDTVIDASARKETIDNLLKRLNDTYIFPDTAAKMEQAVRARQAKGDYDAITSAKQFVKTLTEDLQAVSHDKHLRVRYSFNPLPVRADHAAPTAEERAQFQQFLARVNYGFAKLERLPGNIGYVDLRNFLDAEGGADTVASAFNFLANTDALIFDLRQNGGGDPKMVALITSYLFDKEPVHLNDLHWREGKGERVEEFWTLKEVAGKRYGNKDVYILTSNYTFSAGEEFVNNLKSLKRATVIGETTGGGANPGGTVRLSEHFGVFIPTGRAVNPVTKTNWEGTGVEPDVKVSADQALKTAQIMALKKSVEKTSDEDLKRDLQHRIDELQKEGEQGKK